MCLACAAELHAAGHPWLAAAARVTLAGPRSLADLRAEVGAGMGRGQGTQE